MTKPCDCYNSALFPFQERKSEEIVDVGEFKCHVCLSRDISSIGPTTVVIGSIMNVSVYLCVPCQETLKEAVGNHIKGIQARHRKEPGRNIIV